MRAVVIYVTPDLELSTADGKLWVLINDSIEMVSWIRRPSINPVDNVPSCDASVMRSHTWCHVRGHTVPSRDRASGAATREEHATGQWRAYFLLG